MRSFTDVQERKGLPKMDVAQMELNKLPEASPSVVSEYRQPKIVVLDAKLH